VNPKQQTVTVLKLEAEQYQDVGVFQKNEAIASPTFPSLQLTPTQIFTDALE
jgi:Uma2 family endonuclease